MHITVLCEGKTEIKSLQGFLKRWLDPRVARPVGLQLVDLNGWRGYVKDVAQKSALHLENPKTIAVIGLLDFYGPTFNYPKDCTDAVARCDWAKKDIENRVNLDRFFQFFAVHEVEAWLLSDATKFPPPVAQKLLSASKSPETVNGSKPPAKLLSELYQLHFRRDYQKVRDGSALFQKLDPNIAYDKCPNLRAMLDCMLALAQQPRKLPIP